MCWWGLYRSAKGSKLGVGFTILGKAVWIRMAVYLLVRHGVMSSAHCRDTWWCLHVYGGFAGHLWKTACELDPKA